MDDEEIVLLAWDAVTDDQALVTLLERLAAAFACGSAALVYKNKLTPTADIVLAHGPLTDPAVQRRYALEYADLDPAPAAIARLPLGDVASTDELFGDTLDRYRRFLDGFYYPLGLAGALASPLSRGETRVGMVAIHRGPDRPVFDRRDTERLRRLVPHLARMIEVRQTFFGLEQAAAGLALALEAVTAAVIVLDGRSMLVQANGRARDLLARRDGLLLTQSGQILAKDGTANRLLQEDIASGGGADTLVRAARVDGVSPYVLRVRRHSEGGATVLVADPERRDGEAQTLLVDALGLSAPAAELVAALLRGETLNAYCARRQMSRNTAKYHLNAAFAVTGTRRQGDLLRHATAVARDLGL